MEQLLASQQQRLKMFNVRLKNRRIRVEEAVAQLLDTEDELLKALKAYNKTTLDTYHADATCGWAPGKGRYEFILLGTAKELGYGACGSCGYRVRAAERKKAANAAVNS